MTERHAAGTEAEQQLVFDLMRDRLLELFGPGGSFKITLGRATADDAVFVSTVADTVALQVAKQFSAHEAKGKRVAAVDPVAEHEALWAQIEYELLQRRTGPDSIDAVVRAQHADVPAVHAVRAA
jgi:hypothetical protein